MKTTSHSPRHEIVKKRYASLFDFFSFIIDAVLPRWNLHGHISQVNKHDIHNLVDKHASGRFCLTISPFLLAKI